MDSATPVIDQRNQAELAGQLRELLVRHCHETWSDTGQIAADKWTDSLVQIYGRLLEVIIQHLNRMPDKNFLAFLDTMGIGLLPPRPAKAPLVFSLAKGAPPYARVSAGTQVAAAESPDKKPVIFETGRDLTVIQSQLVRAVSFVPAEDTWRDHSGVFFNGEAAGRETLFDGTGLVRHRIYVGDNNAFRFADNKNVVLEVTIAPPPITKSVPTPVTETIAKPLGGHVITKIFPSRAGTANFSATGGTGSQQLRWYTFTEDSAEPVPLAIDPKTSAGAVNLMASGTIQFNNIAPIPEKEISGFAGQDGETFKHSSRWLFAELMVPVTEVNVPQLSAIRVKVTDTVPVFYQPESAFFGNFPLDLSKDFFPFGERPRVSDVLYLASTEIFSKAGAEITITVALSAGLPAPDTTAITLQWEYWDGTSWQRLAVTEGTNAFTRSGTIVFTCPDMPLREFNGLESRWLRVRITGGGYGQDATTVERTKDQGWKVEWRDKVKMMYAKTENGYDWLDLNDETVWDYFPATHRPPALQSLTLSFVPVFKQPADIVLDNNFFYQQAATGKNFKPFLPFQASGETTSAFYLAFDRAVAGLPATLFFPLITEVFAAPAAADAVEPPRLNWEYWNGSQWLSLAVEDDTMELTRRGMVNLLFPQDSAPSSCFAEQRHWFRARLTQGVYASKPQLAAVYSNAVWAQNRVTVSDELLGSGNGKPAQSLQFANTPVLPGQELLVREAELTEEERQAIEKEEGGDALREVDGQGSHSEKWVRWHDVGHFWFSGPHSRHYRIDRKTGIVTFGDGKKGMIPQAGRNNIQASPYQYGGGSRGNVAKGALTKLRKAIPYVGTVTNPVAAEGGIDVENLDQVRVRGPRSIRHRNKAVTLTDYEWLVSEASPKIARVKGLSVTNPQQQFKPGRVTMMVVPHSPEVKPLPSAELISEVTGYLVGKAPSCLTELVPLQQINLIPPSYLRVDVTASVAMRSIGEAKEAENQVLAVLRNFLHPLTGGPEGRGWEFGRHVYKTEIYEALERIDTIDHVSEVSITAAEQIYEIAPLEPLRTASVFPDHSRVQFSGGRISMALAEGLPKNEAITKLLVLGFMEGDRIELRHVDKAGKSHTLRLYIQEVRSVEDEGKTIGRCVLTCLPVKTQISFPAKETVVETYLKPQALMVRSFLTAATDDKEITALEIAVPTPGEAFVVSHRDWRSNTLPGSVRAINTAVETVFLERDYLVYSGNHAVAVDVSGPPDSGTGGGETGGSEPEPPQDETVPAYVYLANTHTREVHYLPAIKNNCGLALMTPEHKKYLRSLQEIARELQRGAYDYCGWCFSKSLSLR